MQSTVSSQPPRQICTDFRLFCLPPHARVMFLATVAIRIGIEEVPYCFSMSSVKFHGHKGQKKSPILTQIECFWTVTHVLIH